MPLPTSLESLPGQELGYRVYSAISELGYPQHAAVRCQSEGSTVTLKGQLPSFYLTQIAQTIAMKVPGVRRVVNEIEITQTVIRSR